MIIDGIEVLYTIQNGKIVDPNIPTDGLVCYLDTRGKNNTDKHRATLLNLSGNGNHGTLQNFNFTSESGYVKDVGLRFDGVDDFLEASLPRIETYTIFMDFDHIVRPGVADFILTAGNFKFHYWAEDNVYSLEVLNQAGTYDDVSFAHTDLHGSNVIISVSGTSGQVITRNTRVPINDIVKGCDRISIARQTAEWASFGKIDFRKLAVWNRALTDEEIQQLIGG